MARKARTVHTASLPGQHSSSAPKNKQDHRFKVGDVVSVLNYRPHRQWAAGVISSRHSSTKYQVEVGNKSYLRNHNQLKPRKSHPSTKRQNTSNKSKAKPSRKKEPMVHRRTARVHRKPSRLEINPKAKSYGQGDQ